MVTSSNFGLGKSNVRKETMAHTLKKDTWLNEDGKVGQSNDKLPNGWKKGKLLGRKGMEVTDSQAKEWGLNAKAKAPAENKGK